MLKAFEKNIITRGTDYRFNPNEPLTKAEAVTILIRVLGLEGKAPAPGYKTSFRMTVKFLIGQKMPFTWRQKQEL